MIGVCIWLGRGLLALLVLVTVLLLLPFCLVFEYSAQRKVFQLRFLFIKVDLLPLLQRNPEKESKEKPLSDKAETDPEKQKKAEMKKRKRRRKQIIRFLQDLPDLLRNAGIFLQAVFRMLSFRNLRFFIPVHSEDAAATARNVGEAYAFAATLNAALSGFMHLHWRKTVFFPDYQNECPDGTQISGKVYGQLLPLGIALLALLIRLEKEDLLPGGMIKPKAGKKMH